MTAAKPVLKMAELLIFLRFVFIGFVLAEVGRIAFYLGTSCALAWPNVSIGVWAGGAFVGAALCLTYVVQRGALATVSRMVRSLRVDLLAATAVGIWANGLISPWLAKVHLVFKTADPQWALLILFLLLFLLTSPLVRQRFPRSKKNAEQLYFLVDEEIGNEQDDLLASEAQAKAFAETVLESGAHKGLVFGVDGPWGVGKTSFINMAERYWASAENRVIVCRFEPLRYLSESDLADRMIRDLSSSIQRQVFAPEFRPAASRYSRLIKGKADFSFLGFKLSLEPGQETVEELLEDIDEVLKRIDHRVIIVIDDLDRLDSKTINSILFATRRTFKLSQATYVLCYDTEILAGSKEEDSRAREFLEKFVTVKLSLFVDSSRIRDFLRRDWQREENWLVSVPSDTMLKLGSVLNELANILDSDLAAAYMPLVGDLRKVKRFINAMLLMQIEKSDLGRTDFDKRDLINLMLLHLNYPGLFRRIYAEETEGRKGAFSVRREYDERKYKNTVEFSSLVSRDSGTSIFLLRQLFDVESLRIGDIGSIDENFLASRACFNHDSFRNLEKYLKLIVRFSRPEPRETFVLYQEAVGKVRRGADIVSILESPEFNLGSGDRAHDQFWRVLVNQSHDLTSPVAEDAITTLVSYLPRYSSIENEDRGLRPRSVYSLLRLLDRAGWGRTLGRRRPNSAENIVEIAWRIFGENLHQGKGLLQRIVNGDRGVLGWNDLMLFRLQCSADRQGQLHNLHSALLIHQNPKASTTGYIANNTVVGMRRLSQEVFALFKSAYIASRRNFYSEVDDLVDEALLGDASNYIREQILGRSESVPGVTLLSQKSSSARYVIKSFVIYQLSNSLPPNGSGVGCGFYDESGEVDRSGIARLMNDYVFGFCFSPAVEEDNVFYFLDHCLSHLTNSFLSGDNEDGYSATKNGILGGFDAKEMGLYWITNRDLIRRKALQVQGRLVMTSNYIASYKDDLPSVFAALDDLVCEAVAEDGESRGTV
ncbi:KAP family NTPase [Xanthomonas sp. LMG 12460]|uniref:KAP family NTPase n=1 Tax=Xanthomonas sp. LMG 12460 TaxID=1591132 RepID=UPI0012644E3F|nr:KAP family NTPase [Xanthomonas sp. LMG 12460]KAB7778343.1 KAP P-loop protein [Xanthomonas sp. LMG 12460]